LAFVRLLVLWIEDEEGEGEGEKVADRRAVDAFYL